MGFGAGYGLAYISYIQAFFMCEVGEQIEVGYIFSEWKNPNPMMQYNNSRFLIFEKY